MGCDFELSGSQPDEKMQCKCIDFLEKYLIALGQRKGEDYTLIDSDYPISDGMKISRQARLLFKSEEQAIQSSKYDVPGKYSNGDLYGIIFRVKTSGYLFHIVFDRKSGGTLCSVEIPDEVCGGVSYAYKDYHVGSQRRYIVRSDDSLHVWLGTSIRFDPGIAVPYILSFILSSHFIPNLSIRADYGVDNYRQFLDQNGYMAQIIGSTEMDLPAIAKTVSEKAQQCYDKMV